MARTQIQGDQVKDDSITGDDVDESTLVLNTLRDADGDTKVQVEKTSDEDKIRFDTAGVERMTIIDDGTVGIGNTTPVARLEVQEDDTAKTTLQVTTDNDNGAASPVIELKRNSNSPAAGDYIGQIKFQGENVNGNNRTYGKITGKITDSSVGSEDGLLEIAVRSGGSNVITAQFAGDTLKLKNGCGLEVDGNTEIKGGIKKSSIRDVSASLTALDTDYILRCIHNSPITITLPSKGNNAGQELIIKDALGNAGAHTITIDGAGSDTIDGAPNQTLSGNFKCLTLVCDGINGWMIVGSYEG